MLIEYFLADGQKISYDTNGCIIDMSMINDIALTYAQMRPNDLPTDVFMHVSVYTDFAKACFTKPTLVPADSSPQCIVVYTGCGPLRVHAMPWAFDGFKVLVGKREDYDRYDIDKIFEEVVLKDCERV